MNEPTSDNARPAGGRRITSWSFGKTKLGLACCNQTKFTDERIEAYLNTLAKTGSKTHAAIAEGISRRTVEKLAKANTEFAALVDDAKGLFTDSIPAELHQRGIDSYKTPRWNPAKKRWDSLDAFSDRCLEILARIHFPQLRGKDTTAIPVVVLAPPACRVRKRSHIRHQSSLGIIVYYSL